MQCGHKRLGVERAVSFLNADTTLELTTQQEAETTRVVIGD